MGKFQTNDKHVAFCNAVAGGMDAYKAYIEYLSPGKKATKRTAAPHASKLMKRPEIQQLINQAKRIRGEEIIRTSARVVAQEFATTILTVEEMDSFHSAIVQGLVQVEEVIPVYKNTYDDKGRIKTRESNFVRVKRPPNIRERQISISELYKRNGNYAPAKLLGAFGKVNEETGDMENVERFVIFSDGSKVPLLQN